jgi:hypothetical protein
MRATSLWCLTLAVAFGVASCHTPEQTRETEQEVDPITRVANNGRFLFTRMRPVHSNNDLDTGLVPHQTPAPEAISATFPLPPGAVTGATNNMVLSDDRDTWNPCACAELGHPNGLPADLRSCQIKWYEPPTGTAAGSVINVGAPFNYSINDIATCNSTTLNNGAKIESVCNNEIRLRAAAGNADALKCLSDKAGYYVRASRGLPRTGGQRDATGTPTTLDSFKLTFFKESTRPVPPTPGNGFMIAYRAPPTREPAGMFGAPAETLDEYRKRLGCALYYNADDLGVGAELCCAQGGARDYAAGVEVTTGKPAQACFLTAYGSNTRGFDSPVQASANAMAGTNILETVAIVYRPSLGDDDAVQFYLYGPGGDLRTRATFDALGERPSPRVCYNCHGGTNRGYAQGSVYKDGLFIPLNVPNFQGVGTMNAHFTNQNPDAFDALRNMNCLISRTPLNTVQTAFLSAMYRTPGVGQGAADVATDVCNSRTVLKADADIFFPNWLTDPPANGPVTPQNPRVAAADPAERKLLWKQMDHYCAGCHYALPESIGLDPDKFATFNDLFVDDNSGKSKTRVCNGTMPHTNSTFEKMWTAPSVDGNATPTPGKYMLCHLGARTACPNMVPCPGQQVNAGSDAGLDATVSTGSDSGLDANTSVDAGVGTPTCGNDICETGEDCLTCSDCQCAPVCGDGICDSSEGCTGCPLDCGACPICGDGVCNGTDSVATCPGDCPGGTSVGCLTNACMGHCGWQIDCSAGDVYCGSCSASCGDGTCDLTANENCTNCAQDCGACSSSCGDGVCSPDEGCACAIDCGGCGSGGGSDAGVPDAGVPDAGVGSNGPDAGWNTPDAGWNTPDAGSNTPDAGSNTPDAGSHAGSNVVTTAPAIWTNPLSLSNNPSATFMFGASVAFGNVGGATMFRWTKMP